jgi:F-type H+-transporting ATPase subunit b
MRKNPKLLPTPPALTRTNAPTAILALAAAALLALAPDTLWAASGHLEEGYSTELWKDFGLRVINFILFAGILYFLLRKVVKNFFQGRKEAIARNLEYLETQAKNLEEQNQVMRRRLAQLAQDGEGIVAQYERDGQRERDRIIAEAKETAEQIVRKARTAVEQELRQAKRRLAQETGALAVGLAGEMVSKGITPSDRENLVSDFTDQLAKLAESRPQGGGQLPS